MEERATRHVRGRDAQSHVFLNYQQFAPFGPELLAFCSRPEAGVL